MRKYQVRFVGGNVTFRVADPCGWFDVQMPRFMAFSPVNKKANDDFIRQRTREYLHAVRLGIVETYSLEKIKYMLSTNPKIFEMGIDDAVIRSEIIDFQKQYPSSCVNHKGTTDKSPEGKSEKLINLIPRF